jgi:hypothetical protein
MRGALRDVITFTDPAISPAEAGSAASGKSEAWMQEVVTACGMATDLEHFAGGMWYDVGEAGSSE